MTPDHAALRDLAGFFLEVAGWLAVLLAAAALASAALSLLGLTGRAQQLQDDDR